MVTFCRDSFGSAVTVASELGVALVMDQKGKQVVSVRGSAVCLERARDLIVQQLGTASVRTDSAQE